MAFEAPVKDLMFNITHIANWSAVLRAPNEAPCDLDVATAVLKDFGHLCAEEIAPLDAPANRIGSQYANVFVATPLGFHWQSIEHKNGVTASKQLVNSAIAAALPYLMLTENLVAGWQLARPMFVAESALARGEDCAFMATKIATTQFHANQILNKTDLQRARVIDGAASLFGAAL